MNLEKVNKRGEYDISQKVYFIKNESFKIGKIIDKKYKGDLIYKILNDGKTIYRHKSKVIKSDFVSSRNAKIGDSVFIIYNNTIQLRNVLKGRKIKLTPLINRSMNSIQSINNKISLNKINYLTRFKLGD